MLSSLVNNNIPNHNPMFFFLTMLSSPASKRQYPQRLKVFFDFLKLDGSLEEQADAFVKQYKQNDCEDLERQLLIFAGYQKERVARGEISSSTVPNYFKAIKLFCEGNRIGQSISWKIISRSMPRALKSANDRAPTLDEIQKLIEYPDRRIKPLVFTLVSSGIRIGAFDDLKWKHIIPIHNKETNEIVAAKILIYPGDIEQYYSFITPEAYIVLRDWMNYRESCGEHISKESPLMRDIWQTNDVKGAANPIVLKTSAITRLLNRAWQAQRIRSKLPNGKRRHEFQTAHGFRKYFKTQAELARIPSIKIEMLMGHSLGVTDSYIRFTEEQMLEDYLKIIDYLTINQSVVLVNKSLKKQDESVRNTLQDMEHRHRREINGLHEAYERSMEQLRDEMESRFEQLFLKVDLERLKQP
ncbi:hypothetical protein [Candidatus Nitrosocosmicus oleophilus]|nr:hypothetical protein [Candidatus Nitrosocosmicus oleophilus]